MFLYADNADIYGREPFPVRKTLCGLQTESAKLGIQMNLAKTECIKFRRGSGLAARDTLRVGRHELKYVDKFCYLGVTIY